MKMTLFQKPIYKYGKEIEKSAPHLKNADVAAYWKHVLANGPVIDVPDLPKCNERAAEARKVGNHLFGKRQYRDALEKYNESICWAEGDSEDLGIGYANRSATFYDQGEYEIALANIALAKQFNYPQRLMAKLNARETNCREKVNRGESKGTSPCPRLAMSLKTSPRIPFLARGVRMEQLPEYGRSMVADRVFKTGDVILHEKPMVACIHSESKYLNCNHCARTNFHSLIPCPHCVSVMFCGKKCLKEGVQATHRFECGISEKLHHISIGRSDIGPKMFFYGLSLFRDNVQEMMKYCESQEVTGSDDPFTLNYSKHDRLEEFKVFHNVKSRAVKYDYEDNLTDAPGLYNFPVFSAIYFSVYLKHPLIKSLFITESQQSFMLQSFLKYIRHAFFLYIGYHEPYTIQLFSIASVFNHSCDPNAIAIYCSGLLKLIVIRPIATDEQICISYGPLHSEHNKGERRLLMKFNFEQCVCVACDETKHKVWLSKQRMIPSIPYNETRMMHEVMRDHKTDRGTQLKVLQQFIQRHSSVHPRDDFDYVVALYIKVLTSAFQEEAEGMMRANFFA